MRLNLVIGEKGTSIGMEDLIDKYLSKINYTFRSSFCLLPIASCLSSLGNLFCMTTYLPFSTFP
ncbi:hypothetical protein FXO09_13930 [Microcystis aeruginosa KLA2]|nr:hypothetical protein FXO09_13930 [Microcystis aeruginosa KLA2]